MQEIADALAVALGMQHLPRLRFETGLSGTPSQEHRRRVSTGKRRA
jgi:hypothetical protein